MFEPSNGLERLLIAAATDPAQRAAFSKAVLEAHLYVAPVATLVATKITALTAVGRADFSSPLWFSPDGSKVLTYFPTEKLVNNFCQDKTLSVYFHFLFNKPKIISAKLLG